MKVKAKKTLKGLLIAMIACFVVAISCYVLTTIFVKVDGTIWGVLPEARLDNMKSFIMSDLKQIGAALNLVNIWDSKSVFGFVAYGVFILIIAALVYGIIVAIKKKRANFIFYAFAIVFTLPFFVVILLCTPKVNTDTGSNIGFFYLISDRINALMKGQAPSNGQSIYDLFMIFGFLLTGAATFVLCWVIYVKGIIYAYKFPFVAAVADDTVVPTVPNGDELTTADVTPTLGSEVVAEAINSDAIKEPLEANTIDVTAIPDNAVEPELLPNGMISIEAEPEIVREETFSAEKPLIEEAPVLEEKKVVSEEPSTPVVEEKVEDKVEEKVEEKKPEVEKTTQNTLAQMLREVVRDIVRDEISRNNANQPVASTPVNPTNNQIPQTITGATFGGPLVVQYFNGGINGVTPAAPAPVVAPAPAPAPVEPVPAPVAAPAPAPVVAEKKEEVKPAVAPTPVVVKKVEVKKVETAPKAVEAKPAEPKKVIERIPFPERLLSSDKELIATYNEIKNEILSWGVKSRVSNNGDTFRLHKKTYIKLVVAGKSLKLYFALNPKDYKDTTIPVLDASNKNLYADIPLVFKVKSGLSIKRCKQLIQDCMEKDGLEQKEVESVNWAKEIKAELAANKK